jgi:hypothetical protein
LTRYDWLHLNNPSTDNIFGAEILGERRPGLLDVLRRGGWSGDFAGLAADRKERQALIAMLDRVINLPLRD